MSINNWQIKCFDRIAVLPRRRERKPSRRRASRR